MEVKIVINITLQYEYLLEMSKRKILINSKKTIPNFTMIYDITFMFL